MKSTKQTAAEKLSPTTKRVTNAEIEKRIALAVDLDFEIRAAKARLEEQKEWFEKNVFNGDSSEQKIATSVGTAIMKLSNSYSVLPEHLANLKAIFKKQLKTYVNEKTSYGCTAALKTLLSDADYEHSETIRNAVIVKTSPSVTFVAPIATAKAAKKSA